MEPKVKKTTAEIEVKDFQDVPKKDTTKPLPVLKFNEVLVEDLEAKKTFVTNLKTAETYYTNEEKFKILKKK